MHIARIIGAADLRPLLGIGRQGGAHVRDRRLLWIGAAVLVAVTLTGCTNARPVDPPPVASDSAASIVAAPEPPVPTDPAYDAAVIKLRGLSGTLDKASAQADKGKFDASYELAAALIPISSDIERALEQEPRLPDGPRSLAVLIAYNNVVEALIGNEQKTIANEMLLYIDIYPQGEKVDEYARWLRVNGYSVP